MSPGSPRATPRPRPLLMTLSLVLLLGTGCFDVQQELWVQPDGSARLVVDLGLPRSLTALALLNGANDAKAVLLAKAREAEKDLRQDPEVTQVDVRDYEREGQLHLVYDVTVKDVTRLPDLYRRATGKRTAGDDLQPPGDAWDFRIERRGGDYVFSQRFIPEKALAPLPPAGDASELAARELAKGMAKAVLVNNRLTVRIHGPGIGETNGTVNEQKDTVEWRYNLAELVDAPAEGRELRAVIHGGEPLWLWPAVLGVPLAVLLLTVAAARKRRAAAAR